MKFELVLDNLESLKAFRYLLSFVDKDMLNKEKKKKSTDFSKT
jgi:hypothetical protein